MPSLGSSGTSSNSATSVAPVSADSPRQFEPNFDLNTKNNHLIFPVPPWAATAQIHHELFEGVVGSLAMSIKRRIGAKFEALASALTGLTTGYFTEFPVSGESEIKLNVDTASGAAAYGNITITWKPSSYVAQSSFGKAAAAR